MSLTTEQLEQRLNFITGSDAAIICGVSPWGNIIDLWRYKTRQAVAPDISDKPYVKAGNYLEPIIRQWFTDETGKRVEEANEMFIHSSIPYMAGNIDGRIVDENAIIECKTTAHDGAWGKDGDNTIPEYYLCQVAHYVSVCDVERAYIAVLIRGSDFRHYVYERNEKLEKLIIEREKAFWECVANEIPPTPRTADEVQSLYGAISDEETVKATGDIQIAIDELNEVRNAVSIYEQKQKELEDKIKVYMGRKDTLLGLHGRPVATWKTAKGRSFFDANSLKVENEMLYNKYQKSGNPSRRFLVK